MESKRMDAAVKGEVHYHGKPCKKCGSTVRYVTTGVCVECAKAASSAVRLKVQELRRQARESA